VLPWALNISGLKDLRVLSLLGTGVRRLELSGAKDIPRMWSARITKDLGSGLEDLGSISKDLGIVTEDLGIVTEDLGSIFESLRNCTYSLLGTPKDLRWINEAVGITLEDISAGIPMFTIGVGQ
jgi:hypothetical protein